MHVEELMNKTDDYVIVLMGIKFEKETDLIKEINEWNSETCLITGKVKKIEKIETGLDRSDILVYHTGVVNPLVRLKYRSMGWVWLSDYIGNRYHLKDFA